jgi:hypothetical protein
MIIDDYHSHRMTTRLNLWFLFELDCTSVKDVSDGWPAHCPAFLLVQVYEYFLCAHRSAL